MALQVVFAAVNYKLIVQLRHLAAATAYLVGWGVVIALTMYLPLEMIECFDIRNHALKLSVCTLGMHRCCCLLDY